MIVIAYYFIDSTSVKRILGSRIYNAKAMNQRSDPFETDRSPVADGPSEYLRSVVQRNRGGATVGTYAVCSAHPAVIDAAIQQALEDGNCLHVESTSSQVNQFGGYTGMTPKQFADGMRVAAASAGLPPGRVLLGADHLGPFAWRSEPSATAMAKACDLAGLCVHAGYQKIHLDTSMPCGDDKILDEKTVAERAAILCRAAEDACEDMPTGSPRPLYVIGTEVPPPGGEVAEGQCPAPTMIEDVHRTLDVFHSAFRAHGLFAAWENVVGLVVQPAVEFGDSRVFDYDRQKVQALAAGLPKRPALVYEAHSTDYQSPAALAEMVEDHFAILKVGPWLTFAYREAIFALSSLEREILGHKREARLSQVREALEFEMLRNPAYWRSYYRSNDDDELRLSRAFSFSDRCRYYWPQSSVQEEVKCLLQNLGRFSCPLTLLSQYLPIEYEAIREGALDNDAAAIIGHHIRRVLRFYGAACGAPAS